MKTPEIHATAPTVKLHIVSPSFESGGLIPAKYTCDDENISPPFEIDLIPEGTKSLALIADDPDAPAGDWVHWVAWNIPPVKVLKEGRAYGITGKNDFHKNNYGGPCPPSGTHRYFFKFYALNDLLDLPADTGKQGLEKAISGHVIASGELMGHYKRNK